MQYAAGTYQFCDGTDWWSMQGTPAGTGTIQVILTAGATSWTVPSDWTTSGSKIEAVGEGGNGDSNNAGAGGGDSAALPARQVIAPMPVRAAAVVVVMPR